MISSILLAVINEENIFLEDRKMEMIHPTHDPRHMQVVVLDGDDFTIEEVVAVARYHAKVEFAPEFIERVNKSRAIIDRFVAEDRPVYGVTTGFGDNVTKRVTPEDAALLQLNIARSHAVSVGEPLKEEQVRAIQIAQINNSGRGVSGVSIELLEAIRDLLNHNVTPFVPGEGVVGALSTEGQTTLPLIGEGKAFYQGKLMSGAEALSAAGLKPYQLKSKEGLSLLNGTPGATGLACLATYDAMEATRMTGIPMNVLITCLAIACIAFVLPAGLKTVAWTDFIFGIVIVIGGVFVTMKSLDMAGGFSNVVEVLPPEIMSFPKGLFAVGGFTLLSWFLSLVPGGITNQMYFQRVFAIRDEKRIVPTLLISVVLVFLTDVWAFFMGTSIRAQNPDLAGEMATGWLLDQLPIWFIVIFAGMITCTILSTISSGIQSTVVNITRDCYGALNPEAAKDGAKMMRVSRTLTVILIAFAAISAMFIPSVLNTLVYTYSYSAASMLMPVYGAYIFRKKDFCTNQGILASMVGGTVVCIICQIIGTPIPFVAYGLVASIICFFVVGYLTRTPVKAD